MKTETTKTGTVSSFVVRGGVQIVEILGVSDRSFEDAITRGLHKASETMPGITGIEILRQTARVDENRITQYHVTMKVAFGAQSSWEGMLFGNGRN